MNRYVTGPAIKALREKKNFTQRQLAQRLSVSDKAVSKWETGRGLPDLTLLEPLAAALGVSVAELLSGEQITNQNRSANPLRGKFYVCPLCGNVIYAMGEGVFHCCGVTLPPLEAEEPDKAHTPAVEVWDLQTLVSLDHPMEKDHYISFLAQVRFDRMELVKLYPEQPAEVRFSHWPGQRFTPAATATAFSACPLGRKGKAEPPGHPPGLCSERSLQNGQGAKKGPASRICPAEA